MKNKINKLSLSWGVSKGRDSFGYPICRLDDRNNGRRFRTNGGGYDMIGTVFGKWLEANYQKELLNIQGNAFMIWSAKFGLIENKGDNRFYGMTHDQIQNRVYLDGACGMESMIQIAEAIGLEIERDYIAKGSRRGETIGWFVQVKDAK